jgi:hypothetical protein
MSATTLYRIAAGIFILFALGHTRGFLTFRPHTADGVAVYNAMNSVHFVEQGTDLSYGKFYRGFGLGISATLVFYVYLCWHLGQLAKSAPQSIGMLGWIFCISQLPGVVMGFLYFSWVQALFAGAVVLCLGWAAAVTRGSAARVT